MGSESTQKAGNKRLEWRRLSIVADPSRTVDMSVKTGAGGEQKEAPQEMPATTMNDVSPGSRAVLIGFVVTSVLLVGCFTIAWLIMGAGIPGLEGAFNQTDWLYWLVGASVSLGLVAGIVAYINLTCSGGAQSTSDQTRGHGLFSDCRHTGVREVYQSWDPTAVPPPYDRLSEVEPTEPGLTA